MPDQEELKPEVAPISEGEYRVRTSFNVTKDSNIDKIKQKGAELLNLINDLRLDKDLTARDSASFGRLKSLAMTEIEHGVSDAVKAATV